MNAWRAAQREHPLRALAAFHADPWSDLFESRAQRARVTITGLLESA